MAGLLRWRAAFALLAVVSVSFGVRAALAATLTLSPTPNPLPGSQFQGGDGNQDNEPALIDWQGLQASGRVGHTSDPQNNDNVFTSGSEELNPDGWTLTTSPGGASPPKDNIVDIYRAVDRAPAAGSDAFVYLAFTRFAGTGTTFVTFELNQNSRLWRNAAGATIPCRTTGDILISFEQGGNTADMTVARWETLTTDPTTQCATTGQLVPATNLANGVNVESASNIGGAIDNFLPGFFDIGAGTIPIRQFGEAAINLSAIVSNLGEPCKVFGSTWMHSRSSLSETSALHDYVAPEPFAIATCKAHPHLTSSASGALHRRAHRHRLRRHRVLTSSLSIHDTAILSDGVSPTGTITFKLFGPNDDSCTTPIFTDPVAAAGNGAYESGGFSPTAVGVYRWVVEYSGDVNNAEAGPTDCQDDAETDVISAPTPTLTTTASGPFRRFVRHSSRPPHRLRADRLHTGRAAGEIYDTADLEGGFNPTGEITFRLYGPDDPDCSRAPAFTSPPARVDSNGTYLSGPFTPAGAGTYRWRASYTSDNGNNNDVGPTPCDDPNETIVIPRGTPTITTLAPISATTEGSPISDTATLTGGSDPNGTITFELFGPHDTCPASPGHTFPVHVNGNGTYASPSFTPTAAGTYRWVARYSGDDNNDAAGPTPCDDPDEDVAVAHPVSQPSLTTAASPSPSSAGTAGSAISDTATLSDGSAPTGRITFLVYGPEDNDCAAPAVHVSAERVHGDGQYTTTFTPTRAGTYHWIAHYSGDHNNRPAATHCNDPGETIDVEPAHPTLATHDAIPSVAIPGYTQDHATLRGVHPRGTIAFELFGPNDAECAQPPVYVAALHVVGNRTYRSPRFHPTAVGTYTWTATYSGDDNNHAVDRTPCPDRGETTDVLRRPPSLTTFASPPGCVHTASRVRATDQPIYDCAILSRGYRPTGSITFDLYGPDDPDCSGDPVFTTATIVNGNGRYNSQRFRPTASGIYRWRATYSGDANDLPIGPTACGTSGENVHVTVPATPSLVTSASDAVPLGGAIHDTATLSGGSAPTGTITFRLYAPSDAPNNTACSGNPIFTSTVRVNGNGDYPSGSFTPIKAGAYLWVARYSGDRANHGAGTACRDAGETGVVRPPDITPATPGLSTTASPSALGGPIYDTAHVSGGIDPGGAITFKLFGPDDPTCSGPAAFTAVTAVDGNGNYRSAQFVLTRIGTYRWVASYGGDAMNTPVATACGDPAETVTVSASVSPELPEGPDVPTPPPPPKPKPKPKPKPPPPVVTG